MNDWWNTTAMLNDCTEFVQSYETADEYVIRVKTKSMEDDVYEW